VHAPEHGLCSWAMLKKHCCTVLLAVWPIDMGAMASGINIYSELMISRIGIPDISKWIPDIRNWNCWCQ